MYNVIFEEQTVSGFSLNENFGLYSAWISPAAFSLIEGESYKVVWDGAEYEVVGQNTSAIAPDTVGIGNLSAAGLNGNDEPFIIVSSSIDTTFFAVDTEESHTVAVYVKTEDEDVPAPEYNGTIDLISGIRPKNGGSFPLVYAPDVMLTDGRRLSEVALDNLGGGSAEQAVSIDLSAFESNGVIVENYADGTSKTTTVEFDSTGNPIKITDGNGNVTDIVW